MTIQWTSDRVGNGTQYFIWPTKSHCPTRPVSLRTDLLSGNIEDLTVGLLGIYNQSAPVQFCQAISFIIRNVEELWTLSSQTTPKLGEGAGRQNFMVQQIISVF